MRHLLYLFFCCAFISNSFAQTGLNRDSTDTRRTAIPGTGPNTTVHVANPFNSDSFVVIVGQRITEDLSGDPLLVVHVPEARLTVPDFKSNATHSDTTDKQQLLAATAGYDISISFWRNSYWSAGKIGYSVFCNKDGKWSHIYLRTIVKRRSVVKKVRARVTNYRIRQSLCDSIYATLITNKLFSLDTKVLNDFNKRVNNSDTMQSMSISDGMYYEFTIRTKDKWRIIGAYEPDSFYKWAPEVTERKYFITCRDAFYKLWGK